MKKNWYVTLKKAFQGLVNVFKPIEKDNEFLKREYRKAEEEVFKEILTNISVDVETKKGVQKMVPYYLGGRFTKRDIDKNSEEANF